MTHYAHFIHFSASPKSDSDFGGSLSSTTTGKKHKTIRARPAEQKQLQEEDLKPEFRLKVAEWEVRKALAGHSSKKVEEIERLMPDDFSRKLREWEMMKREEGEQQQQQRGPSADQSSSEV